MLNLPKKKILGVGVTSSSLKEILEYIIISLQSNQAPYYITTPNPEIIVRARKDSNFLRILNEARVSLPDGVGIVLASRFLGAGIGSRLTGVDFVEHLSKMVSDHNTKNIKKPVTVGFIGGKEGIAEKTSECLIKKYPGLVVKLAKSSFREENIELLENTRPSMGSSGQQDPSEFSKEHKPNQKNYQNISIDIVFVAYGFPKQEIWMSENLNKVPFKIMIGVGGAFDFISGSVPRAPSIFRNLGLEWFFRLIVQPWRIKRQLALIEFMYLVLVEKIKGNNK